MATEYEDPEEMIFNVVRHIEESSHFVQIVDSGDLSGFDCGTCDLGWVSKGYLIEELSKGSRAWDLIRDLMAKGKIQFPDFGATFRSSIGSFEPDKRIRLSRFARILR
jgi:hypothetical protein